MAKPPTTAPAADTASAIPDGARRVVPIHHGFRRAGRAWPGRPGEIVQPGDLTEAQWAQVLNEPKLIVTPVPPAATTEP